MRTLLKGALLAICVIFSNSTVYPGTSTGKPTETARYNSWIDNLDFEFLTKKIISSTLDGKPKMRLKVTNTGNEAINRVEFRFIPDDASENFPGCATFPNGGFVNLEPGESTTVSVWSNCYFGDGLHLPDGTSDHTANFIFKKDDEEHTITETFQIINDNGRTSPAGESGENMTISGRITVAGGYLPMVDLNVKSVQSSEFQIVTEPGGEGIYTFEFAAEDRDDWFLVVRIDDNEIEEVNFPFLTVPVADYEDPENIHIEIASLDYAYEMQFEDAQTVTTPTGFWRGAVSESEETVVFIPGQENWADGNGKTADEWRAESTIYKYDFEGNELWSFKPGYECWGGDMTRDGSKVVYQLVPNGGTYGMGVLDGSTGAVLWKKEHTELNSESRAMEGLEASFSNDGQMIAIGTVPTGVVSLMSADNGDLIRQIPNTPDGEENWGQIRSLKFDANDEYLYVGSGDNYLRKVKVSDGTVAWKAFIGGWPFVNGFQFSSDGSFIITGTKSFDQARVNTATGETVWINDTGSLESALSANDQYVMNFWGTLMDANNGEYLAFHRQGAESHFFANDELVAKMDRNVGVRYLSGKTLQNSTPSGGGEGGGEQSQWSYMSADGSLSIIAYRDFVTNPGSQVGIAFFRASVTRTNLDPNDNPTDLALSASNIDENNEAEAQIGVFSTTDPDAEDSHSYDFEGGEGDDDNEHFAINEDRLIATAALDFEEKSAYSVRVKSTDSNGASISKVFEITVNDINDAPSAVSLGENTIDENADAGSMIGELDTTDDDANDAHTYTLVAGTGDTDNASFSIEGSILKTATSFNYEENATLFVLVRTDDGKGGTFDQTLTIDVNDLNDTPTDMDLSSMSIEEMLDPGTVIGDFSTSDEDGDETFTYSLVSGDGADDNLFFVIDGNSLSGTIAFDFATKSSYSLRVRTTDSRGAFFEKAFTITVEEQIVAGLEPDPQLISEIYPNPGTDFINIEFTGQNFPFDFKLYDLNGGIKTHAPAVRSRSIRLDVRNMTKGVYLIMVQNAEGGITRKKLIINR